MPSRQSEVKRVMGILKAPENMPKPPMTKAKAPIQSKESEEQPDDIDALMQQILDSEGEFQQGLPSTAIMGGAAEVSPSPAPNTKAENKPIKPSKKIKG